MPARKVLMRQLLLPPHFKCEETEIRKVRNLPRVAKLVSGRARNQIQITVRLIFRLSNGRVCV
jgi:hypothetical protein